MKGKILKCQIKKVNEFYRIGEKKKVLLQQKKIINKIVKKRFCRWNNSQLRHHLACERDRSREREQKKDGGFSLMIKKLYL